MMPSKTKCFVFLLLQLVPIASLVTIVNGLTTVSTTSSKTIHYDQQPADPWLDRRDALLHAATAATAGGGGGLLLLPSKPCLADSEEATPTTAIEMSTTTTTTTTLSDGTKFPLASFGLQIYDDETAYKLTLLALEVGYRNFFASVLARNQKGFARAVRDSGIPREDLFICGSVVSNRVSGYNAAKELTTKGWNQNMKAFSVGNIDYIDQIMLDYPGPDCTSIQGQWSSFQEMYEQKLTKTLSVSNFSPTQLDCILLDERSSLVKPVVNQMPYSIAYHPGDVIGENKKRGILVQAWAPLGGSLGGRFNSFMKGECAKIGKKYGKSFAQVALRWILQTGASFTTQSKNKQHFVEDLNVFDFSLSEEEMKLLSSLA